MKKTLSFLLIAGSIVAFAPATKAFPDNPISLFGQLTIAGVNAPTGTVIRGYEGSVDPDNLLDTLTSVSDGWYATDGPVEMLDLNTYVGNAVLTVQLSGGTETQVATSEITLNVGASTAGCPAAATITFETGERCRYDIALSGGVSQNIRLLDANANGKIDRLTFEVNNDEGRTWSVNGSPALTVTQSGDPITLSGAVTITSAATADPVIFRVNLDESDSDLAINTNGVTSEATELVYSQAGGDGACTNCIKNTVTELNAIATGDGSGAVNTESDYAAPVISGFTYLDNDGDGKIDRLSAAFSETVTAASVLRPNDLIFTNDGDFDGALFGADTTDSIVGAVASATIVLGTEATAIDTNSSGLAISTQNLFSLTDGTNTNATLGAQTQVVFTDGAAPFITGGNYYDNNGNGVIDYIVLIFSENVNDADYLDKSSAISAGGTLTSAALVAAATVALDVAANDKWITLAVTGGAANTTNITATFDTVAVDMIEDANNNSSLDQPAVTLSDKASPTLAEVTAVGSTTDTTPDYVFSTTEAGTITYGGSCDDIDDLAAAAGNNTATFDTLAVGTYTDCTVVVTDSATNASSSLDVTDFTISSSSSGGSGGGGGGGRSSSNSTFHMPTTKSDTEMNSSHPVEFDKVDGILPRPLFITGDTDHSIHLDQGTEITDTDGHRFTGILIVPRALKNSEMPQIPNKYDVIATIKVGANDGTPLELSKMYQLIIPIPAGYPDPENLKIFYYNPTTGQLELLGGRISDDGTEIIVGVGHMSSFLVLDTNGEGIKTLDVAPPKVDTGAQPDLELPGIEGLPPVTGKTPPTFTDIVGHWGEKYITELYLKGVVSGKKAGIYDPNGKLTRAELTKIATLAFAMDVPSSVSDAPYADVNVKDWFATFVQAAKIGKLVNGFGGNLFKPNNEITRAEALKIILVASGAKIELGTTKFSDVNATDWFAPYVAYASAKGIVGGYSDGTFGPNKSITRAEIAKIIVMIWDSRSQ